MSCKSGTKLSKINNAIEVTVSGGREQYHVATLYFIIYLVVLSGIQFASFLNTIVL